MLLCHSVLGLVFIWINFLVFFLRKKMSENINGNQNQLESLTSQVAICQNIFQGAFIYGWLSKLQMKQHNGNIGTTLSFFYTNVETSEHTRNSWVWYFDPEGAQLGINKHPCVVTFFPRTSLGSLVIILLLFYMSRISAIPKDTYVLNMVSICFYTRSSKCCSREVPHLI